MAIQETYNNYMSNEGTSTGCLHLDGLNQGLVITWRPKAKRGLNFFKFPLLELSCNYCNSKGGSLNEEETAPLERKREFFSDFQCLNMQGVTHLPYVTCIL